MADLIQFDFGSNWLEYSQYALSERKIKEAQKNFEELTEGIQFYNKTFLDIGFGQGLTLLSAYQKGALVHGCDINFVCFEALQKTLNFFPEADLANIPLVLGSILDARIVKELQKKVGGNGQFDIVHAWGVLHHTGSLKNAIYNSAYLVKPGGHLILAIYNRHWTSPLWERIKRLYCTLPTPAKKMMVVGFYPIIWTAKAMVIGKNPKHKKRGMDFYYDVIDWLGGYPYEYASKQEMTSMLTERGFQLIKYFPSQVPTGCNEYIFQKRPDSL